PSFALPRPAAREPSLAVEQRGLELARRLGSDGSLPAGDHEALKAFAGADADLFERLHGCAREARDVARGRYRRVAEVLFPKATRTTAADLGRVLAKIDLYERAAGAVERLTSGAGSVG